MTEATKPCMKCGATKPLTNFYKHPKMSDGRVNKCKECNKKDVTENRLKNSDYYKAYDLKRNTNPKRIENKIQSTKKFRKRKPGEI